MDCISSIYLNRSNIPTNMNFGVTQQNGTIPQKDYSQDKFVKHLDEKKEKQKNWKDIATNLAFGALILGGIVCGVRVYSLNKAKNIMKEAFMNENISIGNARKMLREYNEIYESNEKTEDYAKALFNKVKEHFGLSETNLNLKVIPDKGIKLELDGNTVQNAMSKFCPEKAEIIIHDTADIRQLHEELFKQMRKAKQFQIGLSTDAEKMLKNSTADVENVKANWSQTNISDKNKKIAENIVDDYYNDLSKGFVEKDATECGKNMAGVLRDNPSKESLTSAFDPFDILFLSCFV